MSHASNIVVGAGPDSPHAFDIVPLRPRNGALDAKCPIVMVMANGTPRSIW